MPARNLPIQMLSCCDTCGNLQPLRFRFEDREHSVHTVSVTEIVDGLNDGEEVAVCLTAERTEPEAAAERSPFMPAPPGGDKKKK